MKRITRPLLGAAFAALLASQAAPALAEFSYLSPAQAKSVRCLQTRDAGDYETSLAACLEAAAVYKQIGDGDRRNPWYSYYVEGQMLDAASVDYAALRRHREAYNTAVDAHLLLAYVYQTYPMDEDDKADIRKLIDHLKSLEVSERRG